MNSHTRHLIALLTALGCSAIVLVETRAAPPGGALVIKTLSADPDRVTGGDALVEITVSEGTPPSAVRVLAGTEDVTGAFRPALNRRTLVGVVSGLANGRNTVRATSGRGGAEGRLDITNYPITGPVFSGPWLEPFICQTEAFTLPDGSKLGPPLDRNCSARTVVQYVYRSTAAPAAFKPLNDTTNLPADVAGTTTSAGATVNFIVRIETGTMNRGIYQNAILFDPTVDPPPTPFAPPRGWNGRLVALHGVGCPTGWYVQGAAQGVNILDAANAARLARGDALFLNTLNHPTNSCNAVLAGETTMMGKEHFIETFGVPAYTISTGQSGGAYTSLQIADAFPGLVDAISIGATFPDALSIALTGLDAHLLMRYFTTTNPAAFTDAQKLAVGGYATMQAMIDAANQSQRTDPVPDRVDIAGYQSARWNEAVPVALRYHPTTNPRGARPTVFDVARNIYGVNPSTGAALRPFDNVGVQYGLNALNGGAITTAQFLDLNEKIGGVDADSNYIARRSAGDAGAIKRAYQSGLLLGGGGGLAAIPIFDNATSNEARGYHYGWFHFALRDRLRQANGSSDNLVMWRSTSPDAAQKLVDAWVSAYKSDPSSDPQRVKVLRAKPTNGVDGCYDKSDAPAFIAEELLFSSKPVSRCSELYPVYSNARKEAGGPLAANVLKCQLKPIDSKNYRAAFTPSELARLSSIFPGGICDWTKPGVNQGPVVPWASFGPSPKNLVFDVSSIPTAAPKSR